MSYARVVVITLLALTATSIAESATATWDRNPESNIAGYVLSYGTQPGVHTVSIDVGNVITYQFFPPAGQRYYVVVQAYNTSGALGPKSVEAILDVAATSNLAPTLQQPAAQSTVQNTAVTLALVGSDPEGAPLTYSATGLPPGLTINTSTGVIGGTPNTVGTYAVTAAVSDSVSTTSRSFNWAITAANRPPVLTQPANQSSVQYAAASLTLVGSDPDGTSVTYAASGLPAGLSLNTASGVISGAASTPGSYTVTATVSDGSLTAARTFTWTVVANQPPALQQPANQSTVQNTAVSLTLVGSDPESAPLTYSASGLPPGVTINSSTGVIAGTPNTVGTYNVSAAVSDSWSTTSRSFSWTVTAANRPPVLQQPADKSSVQYVAASLTLLGSDPDGTPVTYAASGLPAGVTLNASSGVISGAASAPGSYPVTATVSDGSLTAARTFTWTVVANQAPVLQQPANQSTVQNTAVSLALVGSDPEGAPLIYSASGLPPGVSINTSTGVMAGTPNTVGSYAVTARVSDSWSTTSRSFGWTITAPVTNLAPTLQQPANQSTLQNTAASLTLIGNDPEGAPLTYAANGLPPGLSLNASTGEISGAGTTVGSYSVTASVSDGVATASRTFTWAVVSATTSATVALMPLDTSLSIDSINYVNEPRLFTHTWPTRKIARNIIMKFDLSVIPPDATIDAATLRLSLIESDADRDPTYTVTLHQIINKNPNLMRATGRTFDGVNAWTSSSCCNHNIPMAQSDISPARAALAVDRTLGPKTWNALEIVRYWQTSPATNYGLMLNSDPTKGADRFRYFASTEHPNASLRPVLTITYSRIATSTTTARQMSAGEATATTTSAATAAVVDPIDQFVAQVAEPGDQQVRGDFDGDGIADAATFRPATAEWRRWLSSGNYQPTAPIVWGAQGDLPVAADYDGDRKTDLAVYRPSTGMWHVLLSSSNMLTTLDVQWGGSSDWPVAFDYDRDGRADLALRRGSGFDILLSGSSYTTSVRTQ